MVEDFVEEGVWVDVCAVHVCLVDDLSCDVGEYYEGVIFWECWDVKDGSGLRECVWGQCVGGDCGEELPCFPGLRA